MSGCALEINMVDWVPFQILAAVAPANFAGLRGPAADARLCAERRAKMAHQEAQGHDPRSILSHGFRYLVGAEVESPLLDQAGAKSVGERSLTSRKDVAGSPGEVPQGVTSSSLTYTFKRRGGTSLGF